MLGHLLDGPGAERSFGTSGEKEMPAERKEWRNQWPRWLLKCCACNIETLFELKNFKITHKLTAEAVVINTEVECGDSGDRSIGNTNGKQFKQSPILG